jgi:hypothetical protein
MPETELEERRLKPAARPPRPPHPSPPVPMFREFPWLRRAKRLYPEHWLAAAILLLAFANAVRLLAT